MAVRNMNENIAAGVYRKDSEYKSLPTYGIEYDKELNVPKFINLFNDNMAQSGWKAKDYKVTIVNPNWYGASESYAPQGQRYTVMTVRIPVQAAGSTDNRSVESIISEFFRTYYGVRDSGSNLIYPDVKGIYTMDGQRITGDPYGGHPEWTTDLTTKPLESQEQLKQQEQKSEVVGNQYLDQAKIDLENFLKIKQQEDSRNMIAQQEKNKQVGGLESPQIPMQQQTGIYDPKTDTTNVSPIQTINKQPMKEPIKLRFSDLTEEMQHEFIYNGKLSDPDYEVTGGIQSKRDIINPADRLMAVRKGLVFSTGDDRVHQQSITAPNGKQYDVFFNRDTGDYEFQSQDPNAAGQWKKFKNMEDAMNAIDTGNAKQPVQQQPVQQQPVQQQPVQQQPVQQQPVQQNLPVQNSPVQNNAVQQPPQKADINQPNYQDSVNTNLENYLKQSGKSIPDIINWGHSGKTPGTPEWQSIDNWANQKGYTWADNEWKPVSSLNQPLTQQPGGSGVEKTPFDQLPQTQQDEYLQLGSVAGKNVTPPSQQVQDMAAQIGQTRPGSIYDELVKGGMITPPDSSKQDFGVIGMPTTQPQQQTSKTPQIIGGARSPGFKSPGFISPGPDSIRIGEGIEKPKGPVKIVDGKIIVGDNTTVSAEQQLQQGVDLEKERIKPLEDYLKREPTETATDRYMRLQTTAGRPELIKTRQQTLESITRINNLLRNVERGVQLRGKDVGITTVQGQRLAQQEAKPMSETLAELGNILQLTNQSITDVDQNINALYQAGAQDEADKLQRLKERASLPGLTETEKLLISEQIKKANTEADFINKQALMSAEQKNKLEQLAVEQGYKSLSDKNKVFTDGMAYIDKFVRENIASVSPKYSEAVKFLTDEVAAGRIEPTDALSRLTTSVSSNPYIKDRMDAEVRKIQQNSLSGAGFTGEQGPLSAIAEAVYKNPELLKNYTATQKGKIINEIINKGYDTTNIMQGTLNAGQREQLSNYDVLRRAASEVQGLLNTGLETGLITSPIKSISSMFGGSQDFVNYKSIIDRLNTTLLNMYSGKAVTENEFNRIKGYLPLANDNPNTIKTKITNMINELSTAQEEYIKRATQSTQSLLNQSDNDLKKEIENL